MTSPLWSLTAAGLVDRLSAGEVSPREVLESTLARVEAVNPAVNALVTLCPDRARAAARALEARPAGERGVLAGLPLPIKDSYAVAGVRTTFGSAAYATHVPERSDLVVEAVEASGGIIYGKTNTPEFEAGANTFNEVFGATLNPHDTRLSAAGSSGGAAAAVATGMAAIAQGSDFACSLRYPAAFCGIVGLRPSPGLVPQGPSALPWQTLSVIGPLARSVADCALGLDALARFDARDPLSRPRPAHSYRRAAEAPRRPARLAYSPTLGGLVVDPAVARAVAAAVERLAADGVEIVETPLDLTDAADAFRPLRAFQFAALRADALAGHRDRLKPEVVWNIEEGLKLVGRDIAEAERRRAEIRARLLAVLAGADALVLPAAPCPPFPVGERYVQAIGEHRFETYLDWLALGFAITITAVPALSMPCGTVAGGLPVGLQVVGRPYGEHDLLATAAHLEAVFCDAGIGGPAAAIDPVDRS